MSVKDDIRAKLQAAAAKGANAGLLDILMGEGVNPNYAPDIVREKDKIIVPENANLLDVAAALTKQHNREEQIIDINVTLDVPPWDGAIALVKAIEKILGVVIQHDGFFSGAKQIDVEVELGKTIPVAWGTFDLPGLEEAKVTTGVGMKDGRLIFTALVKCKRRYEERARKFLDAVREIALAEPIHRGKAFSIAFKDSAGDDIPLPMPKFFRISTEEPIYTLALTSAIERNVFTPLRFKEELKKMGESSKRGLLFAGLYGTGKTLLASYIARMATQYGWTFIYVKDSRELPEALRFAQQYQPCVVFAEDVDRIAGTERTNDVNALLNQLDGIDSKSGEIMTILSTNHVANINPAMKRPGRIDMVIEVTPPDAEAVVRMVERFASGTLAEGEDLAEVGEVLAGKIPAQIREVINRAKLEALRRTGSSDSKITAGDLVAVAHELAAEVELFTRKPEGEDKSAALKAAATVINALHIQLKQLAS